MSDDLFQTIFGVNRKLHTTSKTTEPTEDNSEDEGGVQEVEVDAGELACETKPTSPSLFPETPRKETSKRSPGLLDLFSTKNEDVRELSEDTHNDDNHGRESDRGLPAVPAVLHGTSDRREVRTVEEGDHTQDREAQPAQDTGLHDVEGGGVKWFPKPTDDEQRAIANGMKDSPWVKREDTTMEWKFPWAPGVTEEQKSWSASQLDSVIPRMGAKSKLRDWLVSKFPKHHSYVEPFGGSFKVILWKRNISKIEIINDADSEVIHFFRCLTFFPDELASMVEAMPLSQELMKAFKGQLKSSELTGIQRAAAFYLVTKMTFNGTGMGFSGSVQSPMNSRPDRQQFRSIASRLKRVDIRNDDAFHLIKVCNKDLDEATYPGGVFFYLDPPYDDTAGYKSTNGVELGFGWEEQKKLYEKCCEIDKNGNKFIQTNSATDRVYKMYGKNFTCVHRSVEYTVSSKVENRGKKQELIIANFDITKDVATPIGGLFG